MPDEHQDAIERAFDEEGRTGAPGPAFGWARNSAVDGSGADLRAVAERVVRSLVDVARVEEFLTLLSPDVTWRIPGSWPGISGVKDRVGIERFVRRGLPAGFPEGLGVELHGIHAANDVAVVEFTGRARTSRDRRYENEYCFVLEFRDGLVLRIREFMDTSYADLVLHKD